jgi:hypothetical protein
MNLRAVDLRDPSGSGSRGWWAVRCPTCGAWLTKFDFTPELALYSARRELDSERHRCTAVSHSAEKGVVSAGADERSARHRVNGPGVAQPSEEVGRGRF